MAAANSSIACLCRMQPSFEKEVRSSNPVFIGEVEKIENVGPSYFDEISQENFYPHGKAVTFRVIHRWKGGEGAWQEMVTGEGKVTSDCGYSFQVGVAYLVFGFSAQGSTRPPYVDICGRTKPLSEAQEDILRLIEQAGE